MAAKRLPRDMENSTSIGVVISNVALERLHEAARELDIGQNHILTIAVENLDIEALRRLLPDYLRRFKKPGLDPAKVREFLSTLTPEERQSFLDQNS